MDFLGNTGRSYDIEDWVLSVRSGSAEGIKVLNII